MQEKVEKIKLNMDYILLKYNQIKVEKYFEKVFCLKINALNIQQYFACKLKLQVSFLVK